MRGLLFGMLLILVVATACSDAFEYSPNQAHDHNSPRDLNEKNLDKLMKAKVDDTIVFVLTGDSQQFYDEVDRFVDKVNTIEDIDFIILAGDISNYGLLEEFEWIVERLDKLKAPYLAAIGNHDLVANGENVFKRMFGPLDYSFVYDSVKFVFHNTNSREYITSNVPDIDWLTKELSPEPGIDRIVAVSHVPPFDGDFDPDVKEAYTSLFARTPELLFSLHGHVHKHFDGFPFNDEVRYVSGNAFEGRDFIVFRIASGWTHKEIISY